MAKPVVLNWYEKYPAMVRRLKFRMSQKSAAKTFTTLRLGIKWADKLNPGQRVAISISDDSNKPRIIGHAWVISVSKKRLLDCRFSRKNAGARGLEQVCMDMAWVYGKFVSENSLVSEIKLMRVE